MNQISKFINYATSIFKASPNVSINIHEVLEHPLDAETANTFIEPVYREIKKVKFGPRKETDLPFLKNAATNLLPVLDTEDAKWLSSEITSPYHAKHSLSSPALFERIEFLKKISIQEGADLIRTFIQAGLNEKSDPQAAELMATGLAYSTLAMCYCPPNDATKENKQKRQETQKALIVDLLKASISHPNADVKESVIGLLSDIKHTQMTIVGNNGNFQMTGVVLDLEHIDEVKEHIDSFIYCAETDGKRLQHEKLKKDFLRIRTCHEKTL